MLIPWDRHVKSFDGQERFDLGEDPRRFRWWKWPALFLCLGVFAGCGAWVLGAVAPNYQAILVLGPFQSGKVSVILWAVAILSSGLAALISITIVGSRPGMSLSGVVMVLSWIAALPIVALVLLFSVLNYDNQPETHKFTVGDHRYILTSQIGFLIAADDTNLHLYRKEGFVYRNTGLNLTVADTTTFNRDGFSLDREGAKTWLVYTSGGDSTERVRIP